MSECSAADKDDAPIQVAEMANYKKCDKMKIDISNNVTQSP